MQLYITDKTGKRFWNTTVSAEYSNGERHNLQRHLAGIKRRAPAYAGLADPETARLVEELDADEQPMTDDELLAALGL